MNQLKINQSNYIKVIFAMMFTLQILLGMKFNYQELEKRQGNESLFYCWIFFVDKQIGNNDKNNYQYEFIKSSLDPRSINRRMKINKEELIDEFDVPVSTKYIDRIKTSGAQIRTISKWLNAVSVVASISQLDMIYSFPFVKKIESVKNGKRRSIEYFESLNKAKADSSFYGNSFNQLNQIKVDQLHEAGYSGNGVRILVLDSGFRLDHGAFDSLNVIAAYDFVDQDSIVYNEEGKDLNNQHNHGTQVLSVLAGFKPDTLVGPAYRSEFLLGKTEDISLEEPIEEDYFIAGLEWGELLGADIVSSSIGYIDWYAQSDMDGQTAPITVAVNIAIERGMIIITAVGNSGVGGIVAPADAFDVISCGAVDEYGLIASFSSIGPTTDNRIKPEVCALGKGTFFASAISKKSYLYGNGTSLSTPLISGICALLLEAHPDWTNTEIREAILNSADNSDFPNNSYGWGIPNAFLAFQAIQGCTDSEACNYNSEAIHDDGTCQFPLSFRSCDGHCLNDSDGDDICDEEDTYSDCEDNWNDVSFGFPNPCNNQVRFNINKKDQENINFSIVNILGKILIEKKIPLRFDCNTISFRMKDYSSGIYFFIFEYLNYSPTIRKVCHIKSSE